MPLSQFPKPLVPSWFLPPLLDSDRDLGVASLGVSHWPCSPCPDCVSQDFPTNPLHGRELPGSAADLPFAGLAEAAQL